MIYNFKNDTLFFNRYLEWSLDSTFIFLKVKYLRPQMDLQVSLLP